MANFDPLSSSSPTAMPTLLLSAPTDGANAAGITSNALANFGLGGFQIAALGSNISGDVSMETSNSGLLPRLSSGAVPVLSNVAGRVSEGPLVPVLATSASPPRDNFTTRPNLNFDQLFRQIASWGEDESPPPPYESCESTPIRVSDGADQGTIPPTTENVENIPNSAQDGTDWDGWANNVAQNVDQVRSKLQILQQELSQKFSAIEGRENLFPQMAKRIMEVENMVLVEKQKVENILQAVGSLQQTQKVAVDALKNNSAETLRALETDQQKIVEVFQRLSSLESRPTTVVIQTPPEATNSAPVVEEINKMLAEMQTGVHGWQNRMEARFEENNREFSAKFAQIEQWRNEISAKQQNTESVLFNLRTELGTCLRALDVQHRADLAQLHQGVSQVACMLMEKIPRDQHVFMQQQGATSLSKSSAVPCPPQQGANLGANPVAMANLEAKTPGHHIKKAQPSLPTPMVCLEQPQPVVLGRPLPKIDRSRKAVGKTFFSAGTTPEPISTGTAEVRAMSMAPMGAVESAGINIIPQQILSLVLGKGPGPFSGQRGDWPEWKRKFLRFLEEIQQVMPAISDRQLFSVIR